MLERHGTKVKLTHPEATIISKRKSPVIYRILYLPTKKIGIAPEEKNENGLEGIHKETKDIEL